MEKIREFINSVKEGKNGFTLNKPWRLEKTSFAVIPIIKKNEKEREYITFAEAQDVKVEDTGQIDFVYVKNNEDKPLLICRGEIFKGKTQERASIHDYLIMPGKVNRVSVRCIHKSKGIQSGAEMTYAGRTSYGIDLSNQSKNVGNS